MQSYEYLGKPLQIGSLTIKNRFCMAPIGGGQHHLPGGGLKDETIQYLVERAKGGFGLIFTGALAADCTVDPYTGIGPAILQNPNAFKMTATELNERANAYGTKIFAQITMGLGRNYPNLPAPSSVHVFRHPGEVSPELTHDQIKSKIESVIKAAKIAKDSGFAGVEVHSIHWGYLLDQFALSMMNHRTDEYGGSLENRLRAAKEILEGIKQECGSNYPVSMRLGLKTFVKDFEKATLTGEDEAGRTLEEGIQIAKLLESYGYDCLSVDTGTYDSFYYACPPMYMPKGYLVEMAAKAKEAVNIPILAGGRMNAPDIAEAAIRDGKIDAVVMGRAALADPEYPNKVLTGHTERIRPCIACNQGCITRLQQGKQPTCAVNPIAMREIRFAIAVNKAGHYKRVDNACKAACDRVPCTGDAQLYRVLRCANNDTGANAGAYRRCDNKPDAGLSGCREEVLRRTGVLTPAQSDDYVDRHKNDKGNNNQCVQAHLDMILLIYKICSPTLLTGNALEALTVHPSFYVLFRHLLKLLIKCFSVVVEDVFLRIIAERKRFDLSNQLLYRHALRTPIGSKANALFQRCFSIVEIWFITGTPHCNLFGSVRFKIQVNIFVADSKAQEVQHPRPTADARHNF